MFPGEGAWGCQIRQFSVLSITVSSEVLELMPKLLYCIISSIVAFPLTPDTLPHLETREITLNGHFTLNYVFLSKFI